MSLYMLMGREDLEAKPTGVPKCSGLSLLALEVLLKERWE